jgi:hypothetical protein
MPKAIIAMGVAALLSVAPGMSAQAEVIVVTYGCGDGSAIRVDLTNQTLTWIGPDKAQDMQPGVAFNNSYIFYGLVDGHFPKRLDRRTGEVDIWNEGAWKFNATCPLVR